MKKQFLFATLSIFIFFQLAAHAQEEQQSLPPAADYRSSNLDNLSNQLKRQTVDLADRAANDLRRGYNNSRADLDAAFLAYQLDASAGLFQQLVRDNRPAQELRDAASILNDLTRRASSYGSNGNQWRNAQNAVNDISRELGGYNGGGTGGGNNGGGNNGGNNGGQISGRIFWRGVVDNETHLVIRGGEIETRVLSGAPTYNVSYNFTSPLPERNKTIEVVKRNGRGTVRVLQQPRRDNDFTAVVQILDGDRGAKEYQLEIYWR